MNEEPSRCGIVMPAADRPGRRRTAARILVRNGDRVLLFEDSDPGVPQVSWWVTPGGGIDPGETPLQAAVRELAEETGHVVQPSQLVGPVAHRIAVHGYSDLILRQEEWFFLLDTDHFDVDTAGHTAEEQLLLQGSRWWSLAELGDDRPWTWPADLPGLLARIDAGEVVEFGEVEESTVAVSLGGGASGEDSH